MHRLIVALAVLFFVACDDEPDAQPADAPNACGMYLPGVGTWTVAEYDTGYLIDANRNVALRTDGERFWWHRLDGTGGGPVDPGVPFAEQTSIALYGDDHVLVQGFNDDFERHARLIRLAGNRVVHDIEWRFEGRGEWIITGNTRRSDVPNPRLRSIRSGRAFELPCVLCSMIGLDGFNRAWIGDQIDDTLIEVNVQTGQVTRHPDLWAYRAEPAGAGLRVGRDEETLLFGAESAPFSGCPGRRPIVTSAGIIACLDAEGLRLFDASGAAIRTEPQLEGWSLAEFGAGVLALGGGDVTWVPYAADAPVERLGTRGTARSARLVIVSDDDNDTTLIRHADGREVRLDGVAYNVVLSPDERRALMQVDGEILLVDVESGETLTTVDEASRTLRFVGSTLLANGAPVGGSPPADLSHALAPDSRCPVMLYEQCVGAECTLLLQQFAELTSD